ncbi:MAG: dUTP diphosphatase [Paracoccaceae bacterium]
MPSYETPGAAGADLRANLADRGQVFLAPGARRLISTGLRLAVPVGYEVQVRARSGLALRHGIVVPNAPGTIDSDFRGVMSVILLNTGTTGFVVHHGDRIAQMVVAPVVQAGFALVDTLDETDRGHGGFGSTGVQS